eukprot:7226-Eustigmatos_ZCMA.PRE.1
MNERLSDVQYCATHELNALVDDQGGPQLTLAGVCTHPSWSDRVRNAGSGTRRAPCTACRLTHCSVRTRCVKGGVPVRPA